MQLFLQILGANLSILWVMGKILGNKIHEVLKPPYGDLYLEYSWILPAIGVPLFIISRILKLKARRKTLLSQKPATSISEATQSFERKDFHAESQKVRGIKSSEQVPLQSDKLKDLAVKVDWTPLVGGGSNFKSSGMQKISETRLVIKSSSGGKLFSIFFIVIGIAVPGMMGVMAYVRSGFNLSMIVPLIVGLIFVLVGSFMLFFPRPRYLDKRLGWFWVGANKPNGEKALRQLKHASPLKDLLALQIIAEQLSSKNGSYTSWELNIIDKNAKRYNLIDHGNEISLKQDAEKIAQFLSIPVWDNT